MAVALHVFLLQLLIFFSASIVEANNPRKVYLVQMKLGGHRYGTNSGHQELLGEVLDDDSTVGHALIYSYKESFTGFSASLTKNEVQKLKTRREVLKVSRSRNLKLHTTRSWDLMNLTLAAKRQPEVESNLVVAVIDSGITPDLFTTDNSHPPSAWKNKCHNITCNNKIVGARLYYPRVEEEGYTVIEEKSVIDTTGHGTHVASIIAGRIIQNANYFGLAKGTMRGGVPNAKIAVYKTCWKIEDKKGRKRLECPDYTALMAVEDAIQDKVNIISYSQGYYKPRSLHNDHVSWAFLRALDKNILTSAVAGNSGKDYFTVINGAPWIMTVAASVKDRYLETKLELEGETKPITVNNTINTFETQDQFYPIVDETEPTKQRQLINIAKYEQEQVSTSQNYNQKDVFFNFSRNEIVYKAIKQKAKGVISWGNYSDNKEMEKIQVPIESIFLNEEKGASLREYYNKANSKRAVKIHKTVEIREKVGWIPTVGEMSSRGPNCDNVLANILKPDIAAPGVDIIASWPKNVTIFPDFPTNANRYLEFSIRSGTSMACPHVTGLALYLKSFRPDWSPSAIKSALMTTSTEMKDPGNGFAYGSGFLTATKVLQPGLIYETTHQDYVDYICKQGFNTEKLRSHVGKDDIDCSGTTIDHNADLNYPSMTARVDLDTKNTKVIFHRTVTNVGDPKSTYRAKIKLGDDDDLKAQVTVEPEELHFTELRETKNFTVTVTWKPSQNLKKPVMMSNTWLTWVERDGSRQVRSPIVIYSINKEVKVCDKINKN